ncbi:conserved hypothetical protein [Rhodococcus phage E3]|uniref:hypothetical protein n=1 Tax=Rhodococcus phage E3 TaxID=1007869 RepID=UPI0002C6B4D2|nr:hypothetical protein M176_gp072 [Rhodococcus phage E3]AEQ20982.1 conserved hypothetical protein [Rhodococcus phage E3]
MSFGMFDDLAGSQSESQLREAAASDALDRAILAAREQFGSFLASSIDASDFKSRCALVKNDMMKTVSAHTMPLPGVMRRIEGALKPRFANPMATQPMPSSQGVAAPAMAQPLPAQPTAETQSADGLTDADLANTSTSAPARQAAGWSPFGNGGGTPAAPAAPKPFEQGFDYSTPNAVPAGDMKMAPGQADGIKSETADLVNSRNPQNWSMGNPTGEANPIGKPQAFATRRTASEGHPSKRYIVLPLDDPEAALAALRAHASEMCGEPGPESDDGDRLHDERREAYRKRAVDVNNPDSWLPDAHKQLMEQDADGNHVGGFTLHDAVGDAPSKGYMVSTDKRSEWQKPVSEVTPDDILGFAKQHERRLQHPRNYLGGWVDSEEHGTPHAYLDVSSHISDPRIAHKSAVAAKQWGIFDNAAGQAKSTKAFGGEIGGNGPKQKQPKRSFTEGPALIPEENNSYAHGENAQTVEQAFSGPSKDGTPEQRHTDSGEESNFAEPRVSLSARYTSFPSDNLKGADRPFVRRR